MESGRSLTFVSLPQAPLKEKWGCGRAVTQTSSLAPWQSPQPLSEVRRQLQPPELWPASATGGLPEVWLLSLWKLRPRKWNSLPKITEGINKSVLLAPGQCTPWTCTPWNAPPGQRTLWSMQPLDSALLGRHPLDSVPRDSAASGMHPLDSTAPGQCAPWTMHSLDMHLLDMHPLNRAALGQCIPLHNRPPAHMPWP